MNLLNELDNFDIRKDPGCRYLVIIADLIYRYPRITRLLCEMELYIKDVSDNKWNFSEFEQNLLLKGSSRDKSILETIKDLTNTLISGMCIGKNSLNFLYDKINDFESLSPLFLFDSADEVEIKCWLFINCCFLKQINYNISRLTDIEIIPKVSYNEIFISIDKVSKRIDETKREYQEEISKFNPNLSKTVEILFSSLSDLIKVFNVVFSFDDENNTSMVDSKTLKDWLNYCEIISKEECELIKNIIERVK